MSTCDTRKAFLKRQFIMISWSASAQRNPTYTDEAVQDEKTAFMTDMGLYLVEEIEPRYAARMSEEQHYAHIQGILDHGDRIGSKILIDGRYKVANAQKLLNVYLKFLWCADLIPEPPHCPVDGIVLRAAGMRNVKWTAMRTTEDYRRIVELLKLAAVPSSLASWELSTYEENS